MVGAGASSAVRRASTVQSTRALVAGFSSTTAVAQPVMVKATAPTMPSARMVVVYSTAAMPPRPPLCAPPVSRIVRCLARAVVWGLLPALPACVTSQGQEWIYERARVTPAQLDHDQAACRKIAPSRSLFKAIEAEKVDREAFNRCMESRGYRVKVAPLP